MGGRIGSSGRLLRRSRDPGNSIGPGRLLRRSREGCEDVEDSSTEPPYLEPLSYDLAPLSSGMTPRLMRGKAGTLASSHQRLTLVNLSAQRKHCVLFVFSEERDASARMRRHQAFVLVPVCWVVSETNWLRLSQKVDEGRPLPPTRRRRCSFALVD
jgi:hypothetical protein